MTKKLQDVSNVVEKPGLLATIIGAVIVISIVGVPIVYDAYYNAFPEKKVEMEERCRETTTSYVVESIKSVDTSSGFLSSSTSCIIETDHGEISRSGYYCQVRSGQKLVWHERPCGGSGFD